MKMTKKRIERLTAWAKVVIIALAVAFSVVVNDIQINGVRFGLEQIAVMYAGTAMGMLVVSLMGKG